MVAERVTHLPPTVAITPGDSGVILTTTETIRREEAFIDPKHAVDSTKHRGGRALIKLCITALLWVASASFATGNADRLLNNDLGKNDRTGQERDIEGIMLGLAGTYGTYRYGKRKNAEMEIAGEQAKKAETLVKFPQEK